MMSGRPALAGAVQVTYTLGLFPEPPSTNGTPGATGASVASSTVIVTSVAASPPLPSSAFTRTA